LLNEDNMPTTIQTPSGAQQVQTSHEEGGLAVTRDISTKASVKRYVITHTASGCAVGEEALGISRVTRTYKTAKAALEAIAALLPLTDWTRPGPEVAKHALEASRILAELAKDERTLRALPPKAM
jgi:hypothetical protein